MNKRRRPSLRRRLTAQPSDSIRHWDLGKAKIVALSSSLLLCATAAIGFGAFYLSSRNAGPKKSAGNTPIASTVATASPLPVQKESSPTPIDSKETPPGLVARENSTDHQADPPPADNQSIPSTPVSTPAPVAQPTAMLNDNASRERKPSEVDRKTVERERREAERKRSRLEVMYQKHLISPEAYKKGQDEYKNEIGKYRSALGAAGSVNE
jgi:type IV secretory pathway VirB10-like protein